MSSGGKRLSVSVDPTIDDDLARKLPLPLAQLYRRAHNAKTPLERQLTAYYLWEAALKLLASVAIVEYAESGVRDPELDERLTRLARPSLGDWWGFVWQLTPVLAGAGDAGFAQVNHVLFGKVRHDLPRAAGLDALLREALDGKAGARTTVQLEKLFDSLLRFRNQEFHGAAGQRTADFYDRLGRALLTGIGEVLYHLDVLAGRRLVYVGEVSRAESGDWNVARYELIGEAFRRIDTLSIPEALAANVPRPSRVCIESLTPDGSPTLRQLHPLVVFDAEAGDVYFLNSRRGKRRAEYLCYTTGNKADREHLGGEQRELLSRVLGSPIDETIEEQLAQQGQADEPAAPPPSPEPVRTIGEFELVSRIGRGGMGVVYRAKQPSLGREVALKCLLRAGDPKVEARFAREIHSLGRVEHPNLVKIYTQGAEGDQWFYAMEIIEGADLAAVSAAFTGGDTAGGQRSWQRAVSTACEATKTKEKSLSGERRAAATLPVADSPPVQQELPTAVHAPHAVPASPDHVSHVVEIVRQVASAAHALHEHGVIHRDIKPGNVMLTQGGDRAVLVDLGLAQLADETQRNLTRTRQFVGSLPYASPEQITARFKLDRRSDIYSLGALLWELLACQTICGISDETPTDEIFRRIQFDTPASLRQHNPAVNRDLQAVVGKCLEKNPADRYATAQELADDLARWQKQEPVKARPQSLVSRTVRASKKYSRGLAIAGGWLATIVMVAGLAYWTSQDDPVRSSPPIAADGLPSNSVTVATAALMPVAAPVAPKIAKRRALLVGCTKYDNIKKSDLEGPGNDVELMRETLKSHFGFQEADICVLAEASGKPELRPTRDNIAARCQELAQQTGEQDLCVVFLAGGSYTIPSTDDTLEGLESAFFPCDVMPFDVSTTSIVNSITDTEFSNWLRPIAKSGGWLTVIYDASHGGFGCRLLEVEQFEQVVLLQACQLNEMSSEMLYPKNVEISQRKMHGLFTYTLCQTLTQSNQALSYTELIQGIRDRYVGEGRVRPTPWLAGGARHQAVLGATPAESMELPFELTKKAFSDSWNMNAGSSVGLTPGTIFAVRPEAASKSEEAEAEIAGYVRITGSGDNAPVEPIAYGSLPALTELPRNNHCEPVFVEYGHLRPTFTVAARTRAGEHLSDDDRRKWAARLSELATPEVEIVESVATARWRIEFDSPQAQTLYVVQNDAGNDASAESLPLDTAPVRPGQSPAVREAQDIAAIEVADLEPAFPELVQRLSRGHGLVLFAALQNLRQAWCRSKPDMRFELIRYENAEDQIGTVVGERGGDIQGGNEIAVRVGNSGKLTVTASVVVVNPRYDVTAIEFSKPSSPATGKTGDLDQSARVPIRLVGIAASPLPSYDWVVLKPGDVVTSARHSLSASTSGQYHVVSVAALQTSGETSFGFLSKSRLDAVRKGRTDVRQRRNLLALSTPLGKLFQTILYGEGEATGLPVGELGEFSMPRASFLVERPGDPFGEG